MDLSWPSLAGIALTICGAYVVYGLTGFGSTIVAMPLLAHALPLRFAVPMMLVFDIAAGLLLGWKNHQRVNWRELLRLLPWLALGLGTGVALLVQAPERLLLALLGAFVFAYALWSLAGHRAPQPVPTRWAVPTGLVGGVFSALYGVGGVIYTTYLVRRLPDKVVLRASLGMLILGTAVARIALFTGSGLYQQPGLLKLGFSLLPCALLGYALGNHLHARLPAQRVVQAVWWLLLGGGLSLLVRAL
jgi:uncharacterized membrane protein YfcA